jgi:hypothetical protein
MKIQQNMMNATFDDDRYNVIQIHAQQELSNKEDRTCVSFVVISDTHMLHDLLPPLPAVDVLYVTYNILEIRLLI